MELPSEKAARQIASRSVGLRSCMELWARAKTEEELHKNVQSYPMELMKPYFKPELSFKISVETFCNRQSQAEKVAKIEVCAWSGGQHCQMYGVYSLSSLKKRRFLLGNLEFIVIQILVVT